ncbi:hypothetical protein L6164_036320 [Bauhinia variegata]|uniref:Uncharacterized protein n=1 Tax=Bauhinia variegata TaxID=167791 RepID=A0ACB9KGR5_BAUVA|nr:hypothetical protein L6164_036320 [Bauhinia variegata]
MGKQIKENMEDDEELEMLLDEIPQSMSQNFVNHHHRNGEIYGCDDHGSFATQTVDGMYGVYNDHPSTQIKHRSASSPVSGFSLQSDGSCSSLFSVAHSLSDNGSPTPPPLEELKSSLPSESSIYPNSFFLDSKLSDLTVRNKANDSLADELSQMYISNQQESSSDFQDASMGINGLPFLNCSLSENNRINVHSYGDYNNLTRECFDCVDVQSPYSSTAVVSGAEMNSVLPGLAQDCKMANLFASGQSPSWRENAHPQLNGFSCSMGSPGHRRQLIDNCYYRGSLTPGLTASLSGHAMTDTLLYAEQNGLNLMEERGRSRLPNSSLYHNLRPYLNVETMLQNRVPLYNSRRTMPLSNTRILQGGIESITSEGSFIIQGEGLNYVVNRSSERSRGQNKGAVRESGFAKHLQRSELDIRHHNAGSYECPRSARMCSSFPLLPKYNSLAEAQGFIYLLAKDQNGCRYLQKVFDEGTPAEVQVIFNEIIDHVVELMINPFGNYLMQKLLDVCNEEQRMLILLMVTEEPGQLVRISLNTHGTRVVQKLIETLKTRHQISLVVSALEPGFLALIKDLNGNHVVQRCLQCLSNDDNKFIFIAAAKYCVDIATHQHGCCVLQRCIGRSSGQYRDKLVAEISANALLLAQDQYGNYVVQFILDLRIPSATATIISQFEGNYVHLSIQKFSSHVIEKCLAVLNDENQSRIIHELLRAPHFEQLLQDPHANYVVQSALRHSKGFVHNFLVEAIESHKAISRNSPYSKKIFSQKLWKK